MMYERNRGEERGLRIKKMFILEGVYYLVVDREHWRRRRELYQKIVNSEAIAAYGIDLTIGVNGWHLCVFARGRNFHGLVGNKG